MQQHALAMLAPTKKNVSPHSLLASMAGLAFSNALRSPTIAINGMLLVTFPRVFVVLSRDQRERTWSEDSPRYQLQRFAGVRLLQ